MNAAPYPSDTNAKGWRFELDLEQISRSDTWALATPEIRPWLLMLWSISWQQVPCGSLPNDDEIIAARIGMKPAAFRKARAVLMRGWVEHDDGRLYHQTVTDRVLAMLETKQKGRDRKAAYRAKMSGNVPRDNNGTATGQPQDGHEKDPGGDATSTSTSTGTGTGINTTTLPTRAGALCKRLREIGIEAAPHQVTLLDLLDKHSDEQILAVAEIAVKRKPGERITVGYLAPMLADGGKPGKGPKPENFAERDYGQEITAL